MNPSNPDNRFFQRTPLALLIILIICSAFFALTTPVLSGETSFSDIYEQIGTGRLDVAAGLLETYVRQNPDSLKGYLMLARVYLAIGGPNNHTAAERALLSGIKKAPANIQLIKLMVTVKKTQNMPDHAAKWMAEAAKRDPSDQRLLLDLLENYVREGKEKQAAGMRPMIESAFEKNPDNPVNFLAMGKLKLIEEKYTEAIKILQQGMEIDPANPEFFRALSDGYLRAGLGNEFTENYYTWLSLEDDLEELEKEYTIAELTMPNEVEEEFRSLPWTERRAYLLKYWRDADPYPVTEANERLIEHRRRVLFSLDAFRTQEGALGFDDRGKVYIRWGNPPERFTEPASTWSLIDQGLMQREIEGYDPQSKSLNEVGLPAETESWYYPEYGFYAAFDFVNHGGYFHEVSSLAEAVAGANATTIAQKLYSRRQDLGGIYRSLASATDFLATMSETIYEKAGFKRDKAPVYEIALDLKKLEYDYQFFQFRGDSHNTSIELAYGVPLGQEDLKTLNPESHEFNFETALVYLDSVKNRTLEKHSARKYIPVPELDYAGYFIGEEKTATLPGEYEVTFQLIEQSLKAGKYVVTPLAVRDFRGSNLMLSDLKFTDNAEYTGMEEKTKMELVTTSPYPFSFVKKAEPVFLYFEIYNLLLNPNGQTSYKVTLSVERRRTTGEYLTLPLQIIGSLFTEGKPRQIETEYGREGGSQTGVEYIKLDLTGLESGASRLTVTVEDLNNGRIMKNSIEFDLKD